MPAATQMAQALSRTPALGAGVKTQIKLENRLQSKAIVFAWQKQCIPEGKKYSLLTAELKYRRDILCGAELCALHL